MCIFTILHTREIIMTILQSIILGLLQGIAEFLPISSSGHLALVQSLFNLEEIPLLFDIMLHVATLCAVVLFFWKRIVSLFAVLWRFIIRKPKEDDKIEQKMIGAIIIATLITGVFGIVLNKIIPAVPLKIVGAGFLITAALLLFSSYYKPKKQSSELNVKKGLFVGFAQAIGVMPGISRSGITISASLVAGIDQKTAGEFSFLLSIPAILGAFVLELPDIGAVLSSVSIISLIAGCLTAFLAGMVSLKFLMTIIQKGKLSYFAWYLIPLGIITVIFL